MAKPDGPLKGVRVVACSTAQAGTVPYMLMADLGADVIKIEVPDGGDTSRVSSVLPGHPSSFFETNNRGVKSVTLNLKAPEGRDILRKLIARADIFGQNFRPGAAEKNGFGYDDFMDKLLAASPNANRKAVDVADVIGMSGTDANPHIWYDIARLPYVARAIASSMRRFSSISRSRATR